MPDDNKFRLDAPELQGEIYYLTAQEGGRHSCIQTGYRGQFHYNNEDWDALQEFVGQEICHPGETVKVLFQTRSPHFHIGRFYAGQSFEIREGKRVVGLGKITQVLRPDFNYWDFDLFFSKLPPDCKPYDWRRIGEATERIKSLFENFKKVENLKILKTPADPGQMLTVRCKIKDHHIYERQFIDEICKRWTCEFAQLTSHYAVNVTRDSSNIKFEMPFAITDHMYLTGKIIAELT